jgi:hypothetical protein
MAVKTKRGSNRQKGAPALPGAGRPATKAVIENGSGLMLTHVYPEGTADLGKGIASIESVGRSRLIKIPQSDGSEIRILLVK